MSGLACKAGRFFWSAASGLSYALQYQVFDDASRGGLVAHRGADFVIGLALAGIGGGVGLEIGDRLKVPKR
jgi:hypothetical protein